MRASAHSASPGRANARVAFAAGAVVVTMLGLAYASVPLYRLFCQVTGFGGTTQRAERAPERVGERMMRVRFDATVASRDLPWRFQPLERVVDVKVGEERIVHYRATNVGTFASTGTATFNVTPVKAGVYFQKIQCFCFSEQALAPGESRDMAVSFFVDPDIVKDRGFDDVEEITLSYSFFRHETDGGKATRMGAVNELVTPDRGEARRSAFGPAAIDEARSESDG